jgi:RimJ/RimL family protein N-acetyltransferase
LCVRELSDVSTVSDDPLVLWVAQGMSPGVRAWANRGTVAVACPDLSCRDRLVIHGDAGDAVPLLNHALAEIGPTFRPIGDVDLIAEVTEVVEDLEFVSAFGWMDTDVPPPVEPDAAEWLDDTDNRDVAALLESAMPDSYAWPGRPGVNRWAGRRDDDGTLIATAADAWSAPEVGFISGVATDITVRGHGHATATCAVVIGDLVRRHGQAAVMVDDWNAPAIAVYEHLGMRRRHLASARFA